MGARRDVEYFEKKVGVVRCGVKASSSTNKKRVISGLCYILERVGVEVGVGVGDDSGCCPYGGLVVVNSLIREAF